MGLNKRNPQVFDMYRIKLETGELTLDTENPGDVLGWLTDAKFQIRGAISMNPSDGATTFRTREAIDRYVRVSNILSCCNLTLCLHSSRIVSCGFHGQTWETRSTSIKPACAPACYLRNQVLNVLSSGGAPLSSIQ